MLLECFTGILAFPGEPMPAILARLEVAPEIPDTIEPAWRAILGDMTARSPGDRPEVGAIAERIDPEPPRGRGRHRADQD